MAMVLDVSSVRIRKMLEENPAGNDSVTLKVVVLILQDINFEMFMLIIFVLVGVLSSSSKGGMFYEAGCIFLCFLIILVCLRLPTARLPGEGLEVGLSCLLFVSALAVQSFIAALLYGNHCLRLRRS